MLVRCTEESVPNLTTRFMLTFADVPCAEAIDTHKHCGRAWLLASVAPTRWLVVLGMVIDLCLQELEVNLE